MERGKGEMNYLFVVSHPDDEVLGAGATIYRLIRQGDRVGVCILSGGAEARADRSETLALDEQRAMDILGVEKTYHADFPNIKMNVVPHLELVQFIEAAIEDFGADAVFTHHPSDTNIDHTVTGKAAGAAARLFQRKAGVPPLRKFAYMEVPSSTEWSLDSEANRFWPNYYVEIGKEGVRKKIEALRAYKGVMRDYPHPRSAEALTGLAAYRGSQVGCEYAEAFECVLERV